MKKDFSFHQEVLDGLTELVCRGRADGTLLFVNPVYCRFFGKTEEELLGRPWHPQAVDEDIPIIQAHLDALTPANPVDTIENRVYGADGNIYWMQFVNRGIFDADGKLLEIQSVGRDITERKRMELALEVSERRLQLAMQATADGFWDWDLVSGVAYLSPRYWEMIEYSSQEEVATIEFLERLVHPDDWTDVLSTIQLHIHGQIPDTTVECRMVTRTAKVRWVLVKGKVVERDELGRALRMAGTIADITQHKQLELQLTQSKQYLLTLFDSLPYMAWIKDQAGRFLVANQAAAAFAGLDSPKQMVGKTDYDIFPRAFAEAARAEDTEILQTGETTILEKDIGSEGLPNWIEIYKTPVKLAGNVIGIVGFGQYINDRKSVQLKDRAKKRLLAAAVAERTAQLRRINDGLQGFLYAASHDMAGPLGRISNFSTLLERRYGERLDGDGLMFVKLIQENTGRLMALLSDLIKHSEIESTPVEAVAVDLHSLIAEILRDFSCEIARIGAEIRCELAAGSLMATPSLLRQALQNLLGNALKYSAGAAPPIVTIGSRANGRGCEIWVRDNGVGFDPVYQTKIFEIFRRLHTYQEFPGTGVGLTIVKKAVERMNGKVWAEGWPGNGACFHLELSQADPV